MLSMQCIIWLAASMSILLVGMFGNQINQNCRKGTQFQDICRKEISVRSYSRGPQLTSRNWSWTKNLKKELSIEVSITYIIFLSWALRTVLSGATTVHPIHAYIWKSKFTKMIFDQIWQKTACYPVYIFFMRFLNSNIFLISYLHFVQCSKDAKAISTSTPGHLFAIRRRQKKGFSVFKLLWGRGWCYMGLLLSNM